MVDSILPEGQQGFPEEVIVELRFEECGWVSSGENSKQKQLFKQRLLQEEARGSEKLKKVCGVKLEQEVDVSQG